MTTEEVAEIIRRIKFDVDFTEQAPYAVSTRMMNERIAEERMCLICPERARLTYYAQTEILGPRWVDLCPSCNRDFRRGLDEIGMWF